MYHLVQVYREGIKKGELSSLLQLPGSQCRRLGPSAIFSASLGCGDDGESNQAPWSPAGPAAHRSPLLPWVPSQECNLLKAYSKGQGAP